MTKKRVFSGTRATGRLHLGNYLGAVKGYIELQNNPDYDCVYMAVDLHTITTPYDQHNLSQATREIIMDYLAAGLKPEKAIITVQSLVPEHVELAFLFSSVMSVARMRHLPTFKDKVKQHPKNVTMALLNYPVLMAADILAYKAELVPVGIDQEPHLEITREVARKMNEQYGTDFPEPQRHPTRGEYIPSLLGEGKMSKSVEGSYINLMDGYEEIKRKIRKVPTQTTAGQEKLYKGVSALLEIMRVLSGPKGSEKFKEYLDFSQRCMKDKSFKFVTLKDKLSELIYQDLKPIQQRRRELEKQPEYVTQVIREGAEKARQIAQQTLKETKAKMGLGGGLK